MNIVYIGVDERTAQIATIAIHLRWLNVTPQVYMCAGEGIQAIEQIQPEIVLLHPDFTDLTLSEAIRKIRDLSNVPILVLGRDSSTLELITSMELGADMYMYHPYEITEITVRISALLRRVAPGGSLKNEKILCSGTLSLNPATYQVFLQGRQIKLTTTEFNLLFFLMRNRGSVATYSALKHLWGDKINSGRLLKRYVQRLRAKLDDNPRYPNWIVCLHNIGYRFIGPIPTDQVTAKQDNSIAAII